MSTSETEGLAVDNAGAQPAEKPAASAPAEESAPMRGRRERSAVERREVTTGGLFAALRRWWWLPVVTMILGGLLGWGYGASQPPKYVSVTTALVHADASEDTAADRLAAEQLAKSRAATYESLGNSVIVAAKTRDELGLDATANQLLGQVRVVASPQTTDLEIQATAPTAAEATELAGAWREALSTSIGDANLGDDIEIVSAGEPSVANAPSSLSTLVLALVGLAVGLLLGIFAAVAITQAGTGRHHQD